VARKSSKKILIRPIKIRKIRGVRISSGRRFRPRLKQIKLGTRPKGRPRKNYFQLI
jgi:hypothetical protein